MNYTKPVITLIGTANSAVQGVPKSSLPSDGGSAGKITANAYEADE
jgi:hypothetical protein